MEDKDFAPMLTPHALGFEPKKKTPAEQEEEIVMPRPKTQPVTIDPFEMEIEKTRSGQSPAVKAAIEEAECFGRSWYLEYGPEQGICQQWDCDLRSLCELTYTRATNPAEEKGPLSISKKPKKKRRFPDGLYEKRTYVNYGRPVDFIAEALWCLAGGPDSLPTDWNYPPARDKEERKHARRLFIDGFGPGILVSKRTNYHTYFREGAHWMRFWVRHTAGGWLDLTPELAQTILRTTDLKLENVSHRQVQKPHRWYPWRTFIGRKKQLNRLEKVFAELGIAPYEKEEKDDG